MGLFSFITTLATGIFGSICVIDNLSIKNRRVRIRNHKISKNARFVFLTDMHGRYFSDTLFGRDFSKLIRMIDSQKPDFVIIGGDMIVSKHVIKIDEAFELVRELTKKYKVYYCIGNHEARLDWDDENDTPYSLSVFKEKIKECDAIILDNDAVYLNDHNIQISGVSLKQKYYNKKISVTPSVDELKSLYKSRDDAFNIMCAHNPEYAVEYRKLNPDLILSGHMHGGLLRLPGGRGFITPRYKLFQKRCWGVYKDGNVIHIVSQGMANHTLPVRLFNPGEIVTVDIKKKQIPDNK